MKFALLPLLVIFSLCATTCSPAKGPTASLSATSSESEVVARAVRAMREDNILGLRSAATRRGVTVSRVVRVYSLVDGLDDYYLLEMTDATTFCEVVKVSLGGAVLSSVENPLVRVPSEQSVRDALARQGLEATGAVRWVAVNGPSPLQALQPFAPLAECPGRGPRLFVNHALVVFIEDAGGWLSLETRAGAIRLRRLD